jgi:hypothetical protein
LIMNETEKLAELRRLQTKADSIRRELGISSPGEILYRADLDMISDAIVLVEADGFGGATTRIVEGNYPLDHCTKFEKFFPTESEADMAAEQIVSYSRSPHQILASTE